MARRQPWPSRPGTGRRRRRAACRCSRRDRKSPGMGRTRVRTGRARTGSRRAHRWPSRRRHRRRCSSRTRRGRRRSHVRHTRSDMIASTTARTFRGRIPSLRVPAIAATFIHFDRCTCSCQPTAEPTGSTAPGLATPAHRCTGRQPARRNQSYNCTATHRWRRHRPRRCSPDTVSKGRSRPRSCRTQPHTLSVGGRVPHIHGLWETPAVSNGVVPTQADGQLHGPWQGPPSGPVWPGAHTHTVDPGPAVVTLPPPQEVQFPKPGAALNEPTGQAVGVDPRLQLALADLVSRTPLATPPRSNAPVRTGARAAVAAFVASQAHTRLQTG